MRHLITVYREKRNLGRPEAAALVKKAAVTALRLQGMDEPCSVSVTLTDDEGIRAVNRDVRGIDAPTDVLSFPIDEPDYDTGCRFLGDMMISLERAEAQGAAYGGGFSHEIQYLAVHSVLHLLGYDHLDEGEEKARMRAREKAIMEALGYDF